jgi:hypothetical protein
MRGLLGNEQHSPPSEEPVQVMSVGAVYDRAPFLESTKHARSQTAPTGDSPLLRQAPREEGWMRLKKISRRLRSAADGMVAHNETALVSDHPVRSVKGGFAAFLMSRPPLLTRRGL